MKPYTLKEIYRLSLNLLEDKGIRTSELDARVLICNILDIPFEKFITLQDNSLSPSQTNKIKIAVNKRAHNIPVAYIVSHKSFYGLDFKVNKNVLIPRPESEKLVELTLDLLKVNRKTLSVLDIGTGTGNIIISIAKNAKADFYASDISFGALQVAKENAKKHQVLNKIQFIKSDLFFNAKLNKRFDIIIANLPYVPLKDKNEPSITYEPKTAIFSEDNGTRIIKRFLKEAPDHLNSDGTILIEFDPRNAKELNKFAQRYFPKAPLGTHIEIQKDLASFDRYLIIEC